MEASQYLCLVGVLYLCATHHRAITVGASCKHRQARRKKKVINAGCLVEPQYRRKNAERRVVHHDAVLWVFVALVVTTREERSHNRPALNIHFATQPLKHRVIHRLRRITLVGGLWRIGVKFCHKSIVIFEYLLLCALCLNLHLIAEQIQLLHSHIPSSGYVHFLIPAHTSAY